MEGEKEKKDMTNKENDYLHEFYRGCTLIGDIPPDFLDSVRHATKGEIDLVDRIINNNQRCIDHTPDFSLVPAVTEMPSKEGLEAREMMLTWAIEAQARERAQRPWWKKVLAKIRFYV